MPSHDLSEILIQLRDDLLADSDLTDLLGSADAIYAGSPDTKPVYPIIVLSMPATNSQSDGGFTGLWRPDLQFDLLAISIYQCRAISGYLQEAWSIPANNATRIASTNFKVDLLRHVNDIELPRKVRLTEDDEWVRLMASEWKARVSLL